MNKTFKKLLKLLGFSRERHYLKDLINNIENIYNEQKKITYSIYQIRQRGFVVKVGGLFAFVSFKHMPWRYPNYKYWSIIAKHLEGKRFYCNIYKVKRKPLLILIDGKIHLFKKVELINQREYRGILLNKSKYGFQVDIGYDFGWEYGSLLGTMHSTNITEATFKLNEGDEIIVRLNGTKTENSDMDFVDSNIPIEWYNDDIKRLIGTTQEVRVALNADNRREYIVNDKYRATTPATKELYGDDRDKVEQLLKDMCLDKNIPCVVVAINKDEKKLILKILPKDLK